MEPGLLATAREFISGYWPHVSAGAVAAAATVGTAIFAYIRRPKSSPTEAGPYFTDAALLSPPLTRPAYSDRMAYVLAEMSDLAYYQFEGQRGFSETVRSLARSRCSPDSDAWLGSIRLSQPNVRSLRTFVVVLHHDAGIIHRMKR